MEEKEKRPNKLKFILWLILAFLVFAIALFIVMLYRLTSPEYPQLELKSSDCIDFSQMIDEQLNTCRANIKIDETKFVTLKNTLDADTCVMCTGYAFGSLYSKLVAMGVTKSAAKKIASSGRYGGGTYLYLVKDGNVICQSPLLYSIPEESVKVSRIGREIKLTIQVHPNDKKFIEQLKPEEKDGINPNMMVMMLLIKDVQ